MAISVDYSAQPYLITFAKSDLTLVTGTEYSITVDKMWELLRDHADSPEGAPHPDTYRRTAATSSTPAITEVNDPFYLAEFEDGAYSVEIINGNSNFRDVEVKNTVSVGTNNTTGFIDPTFLELGLFNNQVSIDVVNGVAGVGKTAAGQIIGTRQYPSNNIVDAKAIAVARGLKTFNLMANLTVDNVDLSDGYHFHGDSPFIQLVIESAADVSNCSAENLSVSGELDGFNTIRDASIGAITNVSGFLEKVAFQSTVGLTGPAALFETYSQVAGEGYPTITTGGWDLIVRDHHGSMGIDGMTAGVSSIGIYGGRLVIEAGCTGGTIYARGNPYDIVDNSTGTTVIDQTDSLKTTEVHRRLDLDVLNKNTYADDGSSIANDDFTLTKTDNLDGTFDVDRT